MKTKLYISNFLVYLGKHLTFHISPSVRFSSINSYFNSRPSEKLNQVTSVFSVSCKYMKTRRNVFSKQIILAVIIK